VALLQKVDLFVELLSGSLLCIKNMRCGKLLLRNMKKNRSNWSNIILTYSREDRGDLLFLRHLAVGIFKSGVLHISIDRQLGAVIEHFKNLEYLKVCRRKS
jgi:hypothetical protein